MRSNAKIQKCPKWRHKFTCFSKSFKTSRESIFKHLVAPAACKRNQKFRCKVHMIIFENGAEKPSKDARAHFLAWGIKCNNQKCLRWRHKFTWLSKTCKTSTESIFKQIISPTACKRVQKSRCQFHIIIFENGAEKPSKDARAHFLACGIKCKNQKCPRWRH